MSIQKTLGFIIAVVCGIVALLAFFLMPFISSNFTSYTGLTIATQSPGGIPPFWIVAGVAGAVIVMAGVQMFRGQRNDIKDLVARRVAAWCSIELSGLILLILLVLYAYIAPNIPQGAGNGISYGFWIYILAMIGVIIGGIVVLASASLSQLSMQTQQWMQPQPQVWASPPQQWQPVQPGPQTPPPQPWMQSQQWPPTQAAPPSQQWPPTQVAPPSQQWPPTQRSQSSPQWPPTQQQQPPRQ